MKRIAYIFIFVSLLNNVVLANKLFGKDDPWAQFEPPPDSKFDWIQLTSGEWLKGDLDMLYNETVEFNSDEFDDQIFELKDVKRIRTSGEQIIRIEESRLRIGSFKNYRMGKLLKSVDVVEKEGVIDLHGDQLTITNGEEETVIRRSQIIAVVRNAERERERWSGDVSINVTALSGNSDRLDGVARLGIRRRTAHSLFRSEYTGNYSAALDEIIADNHRLTASSDVFLTSRLYLQVVGGEVYSNPISNIRLQYSVSSGLGYYLINTDITKWRTGLGAGYQNTDYKTVLPGEPGSASSPFLAFGTIFDKEVTSDIDFYYEYTMRWLNEESGLYTHFMLATLSFDLTEDLDFDLSLSWDRIESPTADKDGEVPEQDDYKMTVGLSYEF